MNHRYPYLGQSGDSCTQHRAPAGLLFFTLTLFILTSTCTCIGFTILYKTLSFSYKYLPLDPNKLTLLVYHILTHSQTLPENTVLSRGIYGFYQS